jgi:hypothetical protein
MMIMMLDALSMQLEANCESVILLSASGYHYSESFNVLFFSRKFQVVLPLSFEVRNTGKLQSESTRQLSESKMLR